MRGEALDCPNCGSTNHERYRSPVKKRGVIFRRHRCGNCTTIFMTAHSVLTPRQMEALADSMEPTVTSEPTPNDEGTSPLEAAA